LPGTPTPILSLTVPTVGGDSNIWGTELNTDLGIIDFLGALSVVNVSSAYSATRPIFPEMVIRVTTSGLAIPVTLPSSASVTGKIYTVKRLDAGAGTVRILAADGIDNQTEWDLTNQYQFVRLYANGSSYDVIGGS
jgi:hypothetical protein